MQQTPPSGSLDGVFAALADPTRREVLAALQSGSRAVSELAAASSMSLPGFTKHLQVLEDAGLLSRVKTGRVVNCTLSAEPMKGAADWLSKYEVFWGQRLDALARYLYHQKETAAWPKSAKDRRLPSSAGSTPRRKKSGAHGPNRKR
jgi:DNA-binding transcriptional ArsR family regulator